MTGAAGASGTPLYQTLLGDEWNNLSPAVRHAHRNGMQLDSTGCFDCIHTGGIFARLLIKLMHLPPAGREIPTHLQVTRALNNERWNRRFGDFPLESRQSIRKQGVLAETFSLFEFSFLLKVQNGGICYCECGKALRLGRIRLPIPRWLGPSVAATEMPGETIQRTLVGVKTQFPFVGRLVEYQGWMDAAKDVAEDAR